MTSMRPWGVGLGVLIVVGVCGSPRVSQAAAPVGRAEERPDVIPAGPPDTVDGDQPVTIQTAVADGTLPRGSEATSAEAPAAEWAVLVAGIPRPLDPTQSLPEVLRAQPAVLVADGARVQTVTVAQVGADGSVAWTVTFTHTVREVPNEARGYRGGSEASDDGITDTAVVRHYTTTAMTTTEVTTAQPLTDTQARQGAVGPLLELLIRQAASATPSQTVTHYRLVGTETALVSVLSRPKQPDYLAVAPALRERQADVWDLPPDGGGGEAAAGGGGVHPAAGGEPARASVAHQSGDG